MASTDPSDGYRIGTVANLTGLDVHTIRAWERRYGAIKPDRSAGGTRIYGDDVVERLHLLKAFVDCGEPIRLGAELSDDELREKLERMAGLNRGAAGDPDEPFRIVTLAPRFAERLRAHRSGTVGWDWVADHASDGEAIESAIRDAAPDVIVVELEELGRDPVTRVRALVSTAPRAIVLVIYDFGRRSLIARLARTGARPVRGPLGVEEFRRSVNDLLLARSAREHHHHGPPSRSAPQDTRARGDVAAPRYSLEQLARLAEIGSAVECECPNHLASLLTSLRAFERYSAECESVDPTDAALHRRLAEGTARARAEMEDLLDDLCRTEGIEV